jgi:hypothetical protein
MSTSEPGPQAGVVGFQLSALRAYGTESGTIEGVGFWPRAAAVSSICLYTFGGFCAGLLFTIVQVIAAGGHPDRLLVLKLQQKHAEQACPFHGCGAGTWFSLPPVCHGIVFRNQG